MTNPSREELVSAYIDNQLDEATADEVRRMLDEDASLRELEQGLRELSRQIRSLPRKSVPAGFSERVMNSVSAEKQSAEKLRGAVADGPRTEAATGSEAAVRDAAFESFGRVRGGRGAAWKTGLGLFTAVAASLVGLMLWNPPWLGMDQFVAVRPPAPESPAPESGAMATGSVSDEENEHSEFLQGKKIDSGIAGADIAAGETVHSGDSLKQSSEGDVAGDLAGGRSNPASQPADKSGEAAKPGEPESLARMDNAVSESATARSAMKTAPPAPASGVDLDSVRNQKAGPEMSSETAREERQLDLPMQVVEAIPPGIAQTMPSRGGSGGAIDQALPKAALVTPSLNSESASPAVEMKMMQSDPRPSAGIVSDRPNNEQSRGDSGAEAAMGIRSIELGGGDGLGGGNLGVGDLADNIETDPTVIGVEIPADGDSWPTTLATFGLEQLEPVGPPTGEQMDLFVFEGTEQQWNDVLNRLESSVPGNRGNTVFEVMSAIEPQRAKDELEKKAFDDSGANAPRFSAANRAGAESGAMKAEDRSGFLPADNSRQLVELQSELVQQNVLTPLGENQLSASSNFFYLGRTASEVYRRNMPQTGEELIELRRQLDSVQPNAVLEAQNQLAGRSTREPGQTENPAGGQRDEESQMPGGLSAETRQQLLNQPDQRSREGRNLQTVRHLLFVRQAEAPAMPDTDESAEGKSDK